MKILSSFTHLKKLQTVLRHHWLRAAQLWQKYFMIIVNYSLEIVIAIINNDYFEQIYATV